MSGGKVTKQARVLPVEQDGWQHGRQIRAKFLNEKSSSLEEPFAQSRVSCRRKEVTEKKEGARVDDLVSVLGRSAATTPKLA